MTLQEFISNLKNVSGNPNQLIASCPAHEDDNPSLAVSIGTEGQIIMHCHAGCETRDVLGALGMSIADLYVDTSSDNQDFEREHVYVDEQGHPYLRVRKNRPANGAYGYVQHRFEDGIWKPGVKGLTRLPYNYPAVLEAIERGHIVVITEGEKDADTWINRGYAATCFPSGAKGWKPECASYFSDADVVICGDNDEAGVRYINTVRDSLCGTARSISITRVPDKYKDVSEWVHMPGPRADLDLLLRQADEVVEPCDFPASSPLSNQEVRNTISPFRSGVVPMFGFPDPPARRWAVDGIVPEDFVTILGGHGGTGKSLLALFMSHCIATGNDFLGRNVERGSALYVDFEIHDIEHQRRLKAILGGINSDQNDPAIANRFFYLAPNGSLSDPSTMDQIRHAAEECNASFVVIDSLSYGMGADVNRQDEVSRVLQELNTLPTVLALDHVPKAVSEVYGAKATPLGSVMKTNSARSVLMLSRADGGGLVLHHKKSNFGRFGDDIGYSMDFSENPETVVLAALEDGDLLLQSRGNSGPAYESTLNALRELFTLENRPVSVAEVYRYMEETTGAKTSLKTMHNHFTDLRSLRLVDSISRSQWVPVGDADSSFPEAQ